MTELCKFDELRIKTDWQLLQIINTELGRGIHHARQALRSADSWAVDQESYLRARDAYAAASRLIPLAAEITDGDRSRMESRLELLHEMLVRLSASGSTPVPAEDEIAGLAHAFWKARGCPKGVPEEDWFRAERALRNQRELNAVC